MVVMPVSVFSTASTSSFQAGALTTSILKCTPTAVLSAKPLKRKKLVIPDNEETDSDGEPTTAKPATASTSTSSNKKQKQSR